MKVKIFLTSLLIKLAYLLRLRGPANSFQRWLRKEHKAPRIKLLVANTAQQIRDYAKENGYKWRRDSSRTGEKGFAMDWVTHPEVFQAKLAINPYPEGDGDCDDYHNWFAACLRKIPTVQKVYVVSVGYPGGGHTVCCFKQDDQWFLVNYKIEPIDDPNDIPWIIAKWGTDKPKKPVVTFYVFEEAFPAWKAAAIGPKQQVPA